MAGYSQFKNIMHRKGRQDAAKSKLFGKLKPGQIAVFGQESGFRSGNESAVARRGDGGSR